MAEWRSQTPRRLKALEDENRRLKKFELETTASVQDLSDSMWRVSGVTNRESEPFQKTLCGCLQTPEKSA